MDRQFFFCLQLIPEIERTVIFAERHNEKSWFMDVILKFPMILSFPSYSSGDNVGATGLVAPTFYLQEYMPQG